MTETQSARIDHYLFGEMKDADREEFENLVMEDDELFYAVADRENELVDRYAKNSLEPEMEARFRNSLSSFPNRQAKIANAGALRHYIADTRKDSQIQSTPMPWYQRLGSAFRMPAFAAGALGLLLIGTIGFLLVQNRNLTNQLAVLNSNDNASQLEELRRREAELQTTLDTERSTSGDLTSDLESERERRAKLESELADLRKQIANAKPPANDSPIAPTIATLVLRPGGIRGGPGPVKQLQLPKDAKRVAVKLYLPGEETAPPSVNVQLNGQTIVQRVKPTEDARGSRSVSFTVPSDKFINGLNRIAVVNPSGSQLAEFAVMKANE